jgi:hypothetical protein
MSREDTRIEAMNEELHEQFISLQYHFEEVRMGISVPACLQFIDFALSQLIDRSDHYEYVEEMAGHIANLANKLDNLNRRSRS